MNVIVIGGSGFIGAAFVADLIKQGHSVTVVSRETNSKSDGVETISGGMDMLASRPDLLAQCDLLCHFASATIPSSSIGGPLSDIESNLAPTLRLLEAMRQSGDRKIMYLSSGGAIYGTPQIIPIPEDHPKKPISYYGLGKLTIETYLDYYAREHDFQVSIIRPANPYGPGQGKIGQLGAVTTFLRMIQEGQPATLFGDGSTVRDFVHIDDMCSMMMKILDTGATGTWNCGGGTGVSLKELISAIEDATGKTLAINHQPARPFDPPAIVLDIEKARKDLGWIPAVSLNEGIRRLVDIAPA